MANKKQQGRVWKLYRRHPYCWWCGRRVRKYRTGPGQVPGDYATLEHLNSRVMHPDGRPHHSDRAARTMVTVLACYECNKARGDAENEGRDWVPPLMATRKISG